VNYLYYPGCSLKATAQDYDGGVRACFAAFDAHLEEIEEWQCCGGVHTEMKDETGRRLPVVRALTAAKKKGQTLVTVCSACHNTFKRVNDDLKNDLEVRDKINAYTGEEYAGETRVAHFIEVLKENIGFDQIKQAVQTPLTDKKIAAYYGCLLLRPSKVMNFDDPENPHILEDLIEALGGSAITFAERNECCGAYTVVKDAGFAEKRAAKIIQSAKKAGADCLVTTCPLCKYNLERAAAGFPVKYLTDIMTDALGLEVNRE
jgi:heterodisulfide reductase subunit B